MSGVNSNSSGSRTIDAEALQALSAHAEKVAQKLGLNAGVGLHQVGKSDVDPGETRVVLTVYRNPADARSRDFRQDISDLKARIEAEISVLAKDL